MRTLLAVVCLTLAVAAGSAAPAGAQPAEPAEPDRPRPVIYEPPVDAPVVDPFRRPSTPYGPGNRGLEYGTPAGASVRAAANGRVAFAGAVAGELYVSVVHGDRVRTTYGALDAVMVAEGDDVERGQALGTTAGPLHFGARLGPVYVDPATLFGRGRRRVYLVPEDDNHAEARGPAASSRRAIDPATLEWARRPRSAEPSADAPRCTSRRRAPPRPPSRRIAVLVGGLGSTSTRAAIDGVDTDALGYGDGDVLRFSYAGGRVPGAVADDLRSIAPRPYLSAHTLADLRPAGRRLAALLTEVARAAPGVPVDVLAHSQGGVVARVALARLDEARDRATLDQLGTVVTLGTPHRGADLATVAALMDRSPGGRALLAAVRHAAHVNTSGPAIQQLAKGSPLLAALDGEPLPDGVPVLSVAARSDLVVPAPRTRLRGAANITVGVGGLNDHHSLPRSRAAEREMALAIAGLPPTCEGRADALFDAVVGQVVAMGEDLLGLSFAAAERLTAPLGGDVRGSEAGGYTARSARRRVTP